MNKMSGSPGQDEARVSPRTALQSASSESQTAVTATHYTRRDARGGGVRGGVFKAKAVNEVDAERNRKRRRRRRRKRISNDSP